MATGTKSYSLMVGDVKRSYEVIAPVKALPEVGPRHRLALGHRGRHRIRGELVAGEISRDDLVPYATSDQAEIVYPEPLYGSWNAIGCCGAAATKNVNDLAFLEALVAKVDPGHARQIDVVGYSNGARMAYRVACDNPGLFDGYAMVKGEPTPGCDLRKPVSILQLASVNDPEVPYQPGDHGSVESLPITTLVGELRTADKCPANNAVAPFRGNDPDHLVRVRGRHPHRARGVVGRRALLPAAARQRARGLAGGLGFLHQDPDSPAALTPGTREVSRERGRSAA